MGAAVFVILALALGSFMWVRMRGKPARKLTEAEQQRRDALAKEGLLIPERDIVLETLPHRKGARPKFVVLGEGSFGRV